MAASDAGASDWSHPLQMGVLALALIGYGMAAWPHRAVVVSQVADGAAAAAPRAAAAALTLGWLMHLAVLVLDIFGLGPGGTRLGFAPVLSATVWLVIAVHSIESRLLPLPPVRIGLAWAGIAAVVLAFAFPGEARRFATSLGPLHFVLGVASYGLFGAAVLHALLLDAAERRMKQRAVGRSASSGMPLLQLERLTFRFVEVGFLVLSATLLLGALAPTPWRWDHKTVFSILAWLMFAALLVGRHWRGWRGVRATRWLYAGTLLLLLAYVGSRFVFEVLLERPWR